MTDPSYTMVVTETCPGGLERCRGVQAFAGLGAAAEKSAWEAAYAEFSVATSVGGV